MEREDGVVEPDIQQTLAKYTEEGGKPADALMMLRQNYRGYGPMARLVCTWLKKAGPETAAAGPRADDDDRRAGAASASGSGTVVSRDADKHTDGVVWNIAADLLVDDVFDSKVADAGISEQIRAGGVPPWIERMISTGRGRDLIYRMSDGGRQHGHQQQTNSSASMPAAHDPHLRGVKRTRDGDAGDRKRSRGSDVGGVGGGGAGSRDSLFVDFAMKEIVKHGHVEELADNVVAAVKNFSVFIKIVQPRLLAVATQSIDRAGCDAEFIRDETDDRRDSGSAVSNGYGTLPRQLQDTISSLKTLCCSCEEAFVYTLAVLAHLINHHSMSGGAGDPFVARRLLMLKEELERHALEVVGVGASVYRIAAAVAPRMVNRGERAAIAGGGGPGFMDMRLGNMAQRNARAASLICDMTAAARESGSVSLIDLRKLVREYEQADSVGAGDNACPSIELLSGHDVLTLLIRDLYAPSVVKGLGQTSSTSSSERQQCVRKLIALATSGAGLGAHGRASSGDTEEALAFSSKLLHSIVADAAPRVSDDGDGLERITRRVVGNTAAANAVLYCLGQFIHRRHLHSDTQDKPIIESLDLISRISAAQPALRSGVLAVLIAAVDPDADVGVADAGHGAAAAAADDDPTSFQMAGSLEYSDRFFIDRRAFDLMFALVLRGYVLPPLSFLRRWTRGVHVTQQQRVFIREGVSNVLEKTRGPYSVRFVDEIHEIVRHVGQPKGDGYRMFLEHESTMNAA